MTLDELKGIPSTVLFLPDGVSSSFVSEGNWGYIRFDIVEEGRYFCISFTRNTPMDSVQCTVNDAFTRYYDNRLKAA